MLTHAHIANMRLGNPETKHVIALWWLARWPKTLPSQRFQVGQGPKSLIHSHATGQGID